MGEHKNIPTPHIAAKEGDFAKTVLLPGDPLRAKYVAENFLENTRLVTSVRNILGYTGEWKGHRVSVMGTGMGMPSIGIYSYELMNFYGCENLIRIGSAGAISEDVHVMDIVLAQGASTDSAWANQYRLGGTFAPIASWELLSETVKTAEKLDIPFKVGNVLSSDIFYGDDPDSTAGWKKMGILCVEMESAALYMNAARCGKRALGMFTISDELYSGKSLPSEEREKGFRQMMELALDTAAALDE
ncbi:MAG: purine-nucleoside phosphorylase [Lachnospiraceae bacterium]|nr:purine-nucleoside phosphorylase [Lachnospiraceae bacterium]